MFLNMKSKKKIILICSDGGHLAQILELEDLFMQYDYLIVTEKSEATISLKNKFNIRFLKHRPKGNNRGVSFCMSIFSNLLLSAEILLKHYPKVIITTGSHTAVPMCILGKALSVKIVWILSYARITTRAKSADLIYPIANRFLVQWESAKKHYPKSLYMGGVY